MKKSIELVLTALTIALGIIFPIAFHMFAFSGKMFLPMYYPVALAAYILRPSSVSLAGLITPLLSAVLTGMPPLNPPIAFQMAVELSVTGLVIAVLSRKTKLHYYVVMVVALVMHKLVYILLKYLIALLYGLPFEAMILSDMLTSLPGTIILLVIIPPLANVLRSEMKKKETIYYE